MSSIRCIKIIVLLAMMPSLSATAHGFHNAEAVKTAIDNVTVIDAINGLRENQTIVFQGDEILSVGISGSEAVEQRIDGTGKYVIPGLWDMHVHLTAVDLFGDSMLPLMLSYGVTSVRDTGAMLEKLLPLLEASQAGDIPVQRVYFSGPLLDGKFIVYDGSGLFRPSTGTANTIPEHADSTVAKLKQSGASFIKIYEMVDPEVFHALVDAAEKHDLPVAAHVPLSTRTSEVGGRLDSMEHLRNVLIDCTTDAAEQLQVRRKMLKNEKELLGGDLRAEIHRDQRVKAMLNLDQEQCDRTIQALLGTIQVPTLSLGNRFGGTLGERQDWLEAVGRLPEPARSVWHDIGTAPGSSPVGYRVDFAEAQKELVKRMYQAGITFGAGTDIPIPPSVPGHSLHLELEALVAAGLSPLDAIGAATLAPAVFFSMEREMGSIDAGKRADMLMLTDNPLDDIRHTQNIHAVIIQGQLIGQEGIGELALISQQGSFKLDALGWLYKMATGMGFSLF